MLRVIYPSLSPGLKSGTVTAVELLQGSLVEPVVADPVKELDEAGVRLAVDVFQLDCHQIGKAKGAAGEKVRRVIKFLQDSPVIFLDHRGELLQVADHEKLDPAERQVVAPVASQDAIDPVEEIGPHHADLIDDQQVQAFNDVDLLPAEPVLIMAAGSLAARHERTEGQLEKRMESDPAGVDGRHTGRGRDDHPFVGTLFQVVQKGGLAGACLAGQENIPVGVFYKIVGQLKLRVGRDAHGPDSSKFKVSCTLLIKINVR